jgi:hypothetical protein
LSWDAKKIEYVDSGVFHPTIKWNVKSDAIAFLEHARHITNIVNRVKSLGVLAVTGIEGAAFSAPGGAATRGGIWGLYATKSVIESDLVVVTPTKLKLYLTNDGHAEKEAIRDAICAKYDLPENYAFDQYDAIGLAHMAILSWILVKPSMHEDALKMKLVTPEELKIFWDETEVVKFKKAKKDKKTGKKLPRVKKPGGKAYGICNRTDDTYIYKKEV